MSVGDIGLLAPDELDDAVGVARLTDHAVARFPEQRGEPLPQQHVVVSNGNARLVRALRHAMVSTRFDRRLQGVPANRYFGIPKERPATRALSGWCRVPASATVPVSMPLTCLIVDDSPEFLEAASRLLTADGVAVVGVAANSKRAVEQTLALLPDVVLVDVDLGSESGVDVTRRLAELPDGGPPVVLISAESGTELSELVDASHALGFVSKTDLSGGAIHTVLSGGGTRG